MRDIVVIYPEDPNNKEWDLDIDVVNGEPRYVTSDGNTQDQRAAVAALIGKGTIPGNLTLGTDWGAYLNDQVSMLVIDNEVKRMISQLAGSGANNALRTYVPVYKKNDDGGMDIQVYKAQ